MGAAIFCPSFFLFCYVGESVASNFSDMHEILYAIPWHICSTTFQKDIKLILLITQKPVYFGGLLTLDCSQHTFKRVRIELFWICRKKRRRNSGIIWTFDVYFLLDYSHWIFIFHGATSYELIKIIIVNRHRRVWWRNAESSYFAGGGVQGDVNNSETCDSFATVNLCLSLEIEAISIISHSSTCVSFPNQGV